MPLPVRKKQIVRSRTVGELWPEALALLFFLSATICAAENKGALAPFPIANSEIPKSGGISDRLPEKCLENVRQINSPLKSDCNSIRLHLESKLQAGTKPAAYQSGAGIQKGSPSGDPINAPVTNGDPDSRLTKMESIKKQPSSLTSSFSDPSAVSSRATPADPQSISSQASSYQTGNVTTTSGASSALDSSAYAMDNSNLYAASALLASNWKTDLSARYASYSAEGRRALAAGPAAQQAFMDGLSQSFSSPSLLAPLYRDTGLFTKGDVLRQGPQYLDNLNAEVKSDQQLSDEWKKSADLSAAAAANLSAMGSTLAKRASQLDSLNADNLSGLSAGEKGNSSVSVATTGDPASLSAKGAMDQSEAAGKQIGGSATAKAAGGDSSGTDKGSGNGPGKSGKEGNSLRDRLSALLKAGESAPFGAQELQPSSAKGPDNSPDSLRGVVSDALKAGSSRALDPAGAAGGALGEGQRPGFNMLYSETEAEVHGLLNDAASVTAKRDPASGSAFLGRPDLSLFQRITMNLRRCQQQERVRWRPCVLPQNKGTPGGESVWRR
jgi:hypothetical protein